MKYILQSNQKLCNSQHETPSRTPLLKRWISLADGKLKIKSKIKFFRAQAVKNHKILN